MSLTGDCLEIELLMKQSLFGQQNYLLTNNMSPKRKMRRNMFNLMCPITDQSHHSTLSSQEESDLLEDLSDFDDSSTNNDVCFHSLNNTEELSDIYSQYRHECELLLQSSASMDKEVNIDSLRLKVCS